LTRGTAGGVLGRVGRPHGRDGSFYLDHVTTLGAPAPGAVVSVAGREREVERRAGTPQRPILRLGGVEDRDAAASLRGETVREPCADDSLGEDDWAAEDLVGCRIAGLGEVRRLIAAPSCDLLEVGEEGHLVPFVRDAIARIDPEARVIEVNHAFLGLPTGERDAPPRTGPR
jgi:16S rRNA processing protein RimM